MEIAKVWFDEVKQLKIGEAIFLRVANKTEQTNLASEMEKERKEFSSLDPIHASQLFVNKVLKNLKQYVVIERKYRSPYTAFLKDTEGNLSKLTIDPERKRQLRLMIKDKKSREEVEDALNGLTDEEIEEFYLDENKT
ncbi:MAG: hypothetical protein GY714_20005 [Desulfobacterales bacterium]|nr:hypothetical protein [Desulfobacterales bacterium]